MVLLQPSKLFMVVRFDLTLFIYVYIVLKKKYNFNKQLILKYNKNKTFLTNILLSSLASNHYILPLDRLSYFARPETIYDLYYRFCTYLKLTCLISLSNKVPNKQYRYSRFFLNKQLNKIVLSGVIK